jgi:hypothetical protein
MIGENGALSAQEIEEVGYLLEVGWHVRIVAAEMHVVELDVDDVLDAVGEMASRRSRCGECLPARERGEQRRKHNKQRSPHGEAPRLRAEQRVPQTYGRSVAGRGHLDDRIVTVNGSLLFVAPDKSAR